MGKYGVEMNYIFFLWLEFLQRYYLNLKIKCIFAVTRTQKRPTLFTSFT